MQLNLNRVLRYKILVIFAVTLSNVIPTKAQNRVSFILEDHQFSITYDGKRVYYDNHNFDGGMCEYFRVIPSKFENQFFFEVENSCTRKLTIHLFKLNWENLQFKVIDKFYIEEYKGTGITNQKLTLYDNFLIDTLNLDNLFTDEDTTEGLNNEIQVYYEGRKFGKLPLDEKIKDESQIYPIEYNDVANNMLIYNNIAYVYYKNKNFEEALDILEKLITIYPTRIVAHLNIADCYWALNRKLEAKKHYKIYYELMESNNKNLNKVPKYVNERINN